MARDGNGKLPWKAIARKKVKKYNYKTKCDPFLLVLVNVRDKVYYLNWYNFAPENLTS